MIARGLAELMDQSKRQAYFDYLVGEPNDTDGIRAHKKEALGMIEGECLYKYCGLALQLLFLRVSESMGNHDSKVVGADSVD